MFVGQFRHFTPARGTLQKAFFYEERFIYLLQRAGILAQGRCDGGQTYGSSFKLIDNGTQNLIIHFIESVSVDIQCFQCVTGNFRIDASRTFHLCKVAYPSQ